MGEEPRTPGCVAALSRDPAERLNPVKLPFAGLQLIDGRRRRTGVGHGNMVRIVPQAAHSRMRLEDRSVWQVNGMRRDIVNGGETIVAERSEALPPTK